MKGIDPKHRAPSASPRAVVRALSAPAVFLCVFALALAVAGAARAQSLPARPITTAGGRLTISGDASASIAPSDEYYFNYSNYDYNLLRQIRADAAAVLRLGDRFALLGDLRVEGPFGSGPWTVRPYAAFARIRPWPRRLFD